MGALEPLRDRSFRLYFAGQVASHTGTWFQNLALQLVVLAATGSAQALGGVTIAQFLPILLVGMLAGRLADRIRPRTILIATSALAALAAASLALVVGGERPDLATIYALVGLLGTVQAFDRIAAQAIVFELVGPAGLSRAVSISTIALAAARSIGPGLAGVAFQQLGPQACMLLNAASFLLAGLSLVLIRPGRLHARPPRDAGRVVRTTDLLRDGTLSTLLVVNAVIALLAMNFGLVLTATVSLSYGGDAAAVGATHALNAVGAIVGGFVAAARPDARVRSLAAACGVLGAALLLNAAAPTLGLFLLAAPALGLAIGYYQGVLNAAAQSSAPPEAIGRLMSLVTLGNYGMVPFGALLMGWMIDAASGRTSLAVGGIAALACGALVAMRTPSAR
jgi:MFS family permease